MTDGFAGRAFLESALVKVPHWCLDGALCWLIKVSAVSITVLNSVVNKHSEI